MAYHAWVFFRTVIDPDRSEKEKEEHYPQDR